MDTIRKEGKDMRILEVHQHVVPTWAVSPLIKGDTSGNTEADIAKIARFTARCVELANDSLWYLMATGERLGLRTHNALDARAADCQIVEQVILETPSQQERLALETLAAHREHNARIVKKRLHRLLAELRSLMGDTPDMQTLDRIEYEVMLVSAEFETLLENERHDTAALERLFE